MTIPTKARFASLSQAGVLGNYLRTWPSMTEALASNVPWLTIQGTTPASEYFVPVVRRDDLIKTVCGLWDRGATEADIYYREIPDPQARRVANIEVMLDDSCGMYLHLETETTNPVRGIRERTKPLYGPGARLMLKAVIGEQSYETLYALWENYPTAIIEATQFSRSCGVFGQNLVVWEVRDF